MTTQLLSFVSDKTLSLVSPVAAYWLFSGFFYMMSELRLPFFEKYKIHTPEEEKAKNKVTVKEVMGNVLLQQILQTMVGLLIVAAESEDQTDYSFTPISVLASQYQEECFQFFNVISLCQLDPSTAYFLALVSQFMTWVAIPFARFMVALFVLDTIEYFLHRWFHNNAFLYRTFHSVHHRVYCPYAFGALYNHPLEGFVLDSVGAGIAFTMSGLSTRGAIVFFTFSTIKTIDDHCGYSLPFDPLQRIFGNNVAYHDIHHQLYGLKSNYSQPFFTHWDRLLGTYISPSEAKQKRAQTQAEKNVKPTGHSTQSATRINSSLKQSSRVRI
ncbi:Sphingolipid C4-hydroxylase sur2 [Basidiobolus ranarum]|uniref:Sphingolipid C4-hydroxylase sur2 n=1 Tax=Basidiobolus ranarum TaxID=34480 RepID=A0ABR2WYJ6_9FUNG